MDAPAYSVVTTAHFDRLIKKLAPKHSELDPLNKSRKYPIKKLQGVSAGEGQHRVRSGRFRFRYDIAGREVVLLHCGLRREDTY
jgi:mRNA-degrading endonuclease RelE of RelBE toxin-antitoxin system